MTAPDLDPIRRPSPPLASGGPAVGGPPSSATERLGPSRETTATLIGGGIVVLVCVAFFALGSFTDADTWVPVAVAFSLAMISLPICSRIAGTPRDRRLYKILVIAFSLKMLCAGPRYALNEVYYKGEVDAARYDQAGDFFVQNASQGKWSIEGSELDGFPKETRVVGYVVGGLYVIFGTTYFGGYLIFSWLSWIGLVLCFKAFRVAFPNAPPYRAAMLIFFLPSMLFWPSSLGKDALMVFCVGLFSLGISRIVSADRVGRGLLLTAAGFYLASLVRPHLVLIALVALAASTLARSSRSSGFRTVIFRVLVIAAIFPLMLVGLSRLGSVVGGNPDNAAGFEESLDKTVERTNRGGSAFETSGVRSPLDIPTATITVIYRPFLFEARNVGVLIAAVEGTILLVMTLAASRWIWRIGPAMVTSPMAAWCGAFVFAFVIAFSNIGNAGILARQRVQMFPVLMILVAAAYEHKRVHELADPASTDEEARPTSPILSPTAYTTLGSPIS